MVRHHGMVCVVREGVRPTCGDWIGGEGAYSLVPFVHNGSTNGDGRMGHAASPYITSRAGLGWATLFLIVVGLGVNVDYSAPPCIAMVVPLSCDPTVQMAAKVFSRPSSSKLFILRALSLVLYSILASRPCLFDRLTS